MKDGVSATRTGSLKVSRIRAWIHPGDFVSKNMDGWSQPPEELEKSFSRTGAEVWDWCILGEKSHLERISKHLERISLGADSTERFQGAG